MTISASYLPLQVVAGGGATNFTIPFPFVEDEDVVVYVDGILFTAYSIVGLDVVFNAAAAGGEVVQIYRNTSRFQLLDYNEGTRFPAASHEEGLDRIHRILQELDDKASRALLYPITSTHRDDILPEPLSGYVLGGNPTSTAYTLLAADGTHITTFDFRKLSDYGTWAEMVAAVGASAETVLIDATKTVPSNLTVPANIKAWFLPGVQIKPDTGVNVNFGAAPVTFGRYRIFDVSLGGTIKFLAMSGLEVYPEWWGADPTGVADCKAAFEAAVASLPTTLLAVDARRGGVGGTVLGGGPSATYYFSASLTEMRTHFLTIDMQGALLWSDSTSYTHLFRLSGDTGIAGDRSQMIQRPIFRNCRMGRADDTTNRKAPVLIEWSEDALVENVQIQGATNGVDIQISDRATVRKVRITGAHEANVMLSFFLSNDCLAEDVVIDGGATATWQHAVVQPKGGTNCTFRSITVKNIPEKDPTSGSVAFFSRGDAPGKPSTPSINGGYTYPWEDLGFDVEDPRRASYDMLYEDCRVENCPGLIAFFHTEATDSRFINCTATNVYAGLVIDSADSDAYDASGCTAENLTLQQIAITRENVNQRGIELVGESVHIRHVKLRTIRIEECWGTGVLIDGADDLLMEDVAVYDAGTGEGTGQDDGFLLRNVLRPTLSHCVAIDTRGTPLMRNGIRATATTVLYPTVIGCTVRNTIEQRIKVWALGFYSANDPGELTGQTLDATAHVDWLRWHFPTNAVAWIEVVCIGRAPATGDFAWYHLAQGFYLDGSSKVQSFGGVQAQVSMWHPMNTALLVDNSGGTANTTIAAIPSIDVTGTGNAAGFTDTRDAIADLAARTNSLIKVPNGFATDASWTSPRFTNLNVNTILYFSVNGKAATTIDWTVHARTYVWRT